jgi:hypothetical protein
MITLVPERVVKPGWPVVIGMVRSSAVGEDLHLVGLRVDLVDVGVADVEVDDPDSWP